MNVRAVDACAVQRVNLKRGSSASVSTAPLRISLGATVQTSRLQPCHLVLPQCFRLHERALL